MASSAPAIRKGDWFAYFPEHYLWSILFMGGLSMARWGWVEMGEVERVGKILKTDVGNNELWWETWVAAADRLCELAEETTLVGTATSAAMHWRRAACYYFLADLQRHPKDDAANDVFRRAQRAFDHAVVDLPGSRVTRVQVPFEDGYLPSLFEKAVDASTETPGPSMIVLDGFEGCKEYTYMHGVSSLVDRGISCLVMDSPGVGEAVRFLGHKLRHDYEVVAAAAIEYLTARGDIDPTRIGVQGSSLGGYYASRAGAREPRLRCCVAWGAIWDYHADWTRRLKGADQARLPALQHNLQYVFGVESPEAALAKLVPFQLDGVIQDMRCSYLVVHGEDDQQIPVEDAHKLYEASGSSDKTLRIFSVEEGGHQHCQIDNLSLGAAYVHDWIEQHLAPT